MNERGRVPKGSEGSREVRGVCMEVIGVAADTAPSSGKGESYGVFGGGGMTAMVVEVLLGVGGVVNSAGLTSGSIARLGASGGW